MLTITIETENDAFANGKGREVARILSGIAQRIKEGETDDFKVRDINGNTVGTVSLD